MKGLHQQSRILSVLAKHNLLDVERVPIITDNYAQQHKPFIRFLIEDNKLDALELARVFSLNFGLPLFDLNQFNTSHIPQSAKNEALMRKHQALPLYLRGKILFIAMADPTEVDALEEIQFNTGYTTELVIVSEPVLHKLIDKVFEDNITTLNMGNIDNDALSKIEVQEEVTHDNNTNDIDDAPIIQYLNKILFDAIKKGASDLHFEPYEKLFRIRFRIDGILTEVAQPPVNLAARMAASLKVMAKLDIAERRLPQDGRLKLSLSKNKAIDFRVSTLPTMWGEKIVMRILDSSSAMLGIDMLGYEPAQQSIYLQALAQPQGMVLVTGPTGSGKTVSLYTGLNILNTAAHNISTAEDPVEMNLTGINQVQINTKAGLNFPNILRSFLRQDPDVIMVGEIRDLDTAEIAIKASQTGHLVLSTLHTNSAAETLTRLLNMGVPSYNIASSVSVIIAQRLARKLCEYCKEEVRVPAAELLKQGFTQAQLHSAVLYKHVGCEHCTNGYKGRLGVYEVVKISDEVSNIIMSGGNSIDIAQQFQQEGYNNLRQSGLLKVLQGVTSLEEINRITNN